MNQNVFGAILFSVIVGMAIFVSEYFVVLPTPPSVYESPITVNKKYSCSHQGRTVINQTSPTGVASVKVVQAVLNQRTNQLNTDFAIKLDNPQTQAVSVSLHFFVKDGAKTIYLATETMIVQPDFDFEGKANHEVISSFQWLDDLQKRDNLYVIAEPSISFNNSRTLEPKFDANLATPILLMKVKE